MQISKRAVGDVTILDVNGPASAGEAGQPLLGAVEAAVGQGAVNILMNLESVSRIDGRELTELAVAYQVVAAHSGQLKLESVSSEVRDMLRQTQLDDIIPIFSEEAQAIVAFEHP